MLYFSNKYFNIILPSVSGSPSDVFSSCLPTKIICNFLSSLQSTTNKMQRFTFFLFISVSRSTCFRWFFHSSSGAGNCTYNVRYWSDKYLMLYVQFWAPDDGRKNRPKHVERLTEINKKWNVASCWLYSVNILAMHGPMNVQFLTSVCHIMPVPSHPMLMVQFMKTSCSQCKFFHSSVAWYLVKSKHSPHQSLHRNLCSSLTVEY